MKSIKLGNKAYATFPSVLDQAHKEGLTCIDSHHIQVGDETNNFKDIFKATVTTKKGTFSATGDACPKNVGRMILPHITRMAETRAIGRALRMATNAATLAEETELEVNAQPLPTKVSNGTPSKKDEPQLKKLEPKILLAMIDWIGKGGSDDVKEKLPSYKRTKAQDTKLKKAFESYKNGDHEQD